VLIDFGTCCNLRRQDSGLGWCKIPHTGAIGKRSYMCPSVYIPIENSYDATAADAWSLGVTFFAMLTAKPPFMTPWGEDRNFVRIAKEQRLAEVFRTWQRNVPFHFDLSDRVLDLLQRLLLIRPIDRLTIDGALHHPFFHPM
jgi:serine/threonine protein kinase